MLEDLGVDSLITPEFINYIKVSLGVELSSAEFAELVDVESPLGLLADTLGVEDGKPTPTTGSSRISDAVAPSDPVMSTIFQEIRCNYDAYAKAFQSTGYWEHVYPVQLQVVSGLAGGPRPRRGSLLGARGGRQAKSGAETEGKR